MLHRIARRVVSRLLLTFLFALLLCEATLRWLDPWGVMKVGADNILRYATGDPDLGYSLPPGIYKMNGWIATIGPDRTRMVPHAAPNGCQIVIAGDSVGLPIDVSNDQAWPDLLARQFPTVQMINPSLSGYNIGNAVNVANKYRRADGILYLMIGNDAEPDYDWRQPFTGESYSAVSMYWYWATHLVKPPGPGAALPTITLPAAFEASLRNLAARSNVKIAGFANDSLALASKREVPGMVILAPYTGRISVADPHPDIEGNKQIAAALLPAFTEFVNRVCKPIF